MLSLYSQASFGDCSFVLCVPRQFNGDDIFNADETGLFYKLTLNKTLKFKVVQCKGGKLSKDNNCVNLCEFVRKKENSLLENRKMYVEKCWKFTPLKQSQPTSVGDGRNFDCRTLWMGSKTEKKKSEKCYC